MPASGLKLTSNNHPWRWVPSLYFFEGLPNVLVTSVAIILLQNMGIDDTRSTFYVSLLYLPWIIKPFWSPFIDMFGTKRRWVVSMQLLMAACVGVMALSLSSSVWLAVALSLFWLLAFSSATHDIAADGFYMMALTDKEQDFFVGIRSTAYRLAGLFISGVVVWFAGRLIIVGYSTVTAWQLSLGALAAIFVALTLWHSFSLPKPAADMPNCATSLRGIAAGFAQNITTFFTRKGIWLSVAFLMLYRLPEAILDKIAAPFLLAGTASGGLGLTTAQVGIANGTAGMVGGIIGGIIGGIVVAHYGLRKCIWPMALALTLPSAFYCYLAIAQPTNMALISCGIAFEKFGYIFGYTAMMVYMLRINENSPYSTSHFAFCTGIAFLGLMLPGLFAGAISTALGYANAFNLVMALCPITYLATWLVYRKLK